MEVLVSSFGPHIIKGLVGYLQILGVTQSTAYRTKKSTNENDEARVLAHIAAIREVGVFPASLMALTNSHCSLPPCLTAIL